jgi:hypothetical protein
MQSNKQATILFDLMGNEIINKFRYRFMGEQVKYEIKSFIRHKLNELMIYSENSDIDVQIPTETQDFNIFISEELGNRLRHFEYLNPEYFI